MLRLVARTLLLVSLSLSLAACAKPRRVVEAPPVYDIRAVTVTANKDVPPAVLRGIRDRLDKAITATVRPVPMPRAVMTVRVVQTTKAAALDGVRGQAEVSVVLSEVTSAHPIDVRNFQIMSFSDNNPASNAAMAEAIASRLRFEYKLAIPPIRKNPYVNPPISTRMSGERMVEPSAQPLVIPLKTAPVVGADQDPVLNSKTRIEPVKEPARIEVDPKPAAATPVENPLETGAKVKVVITPKKLEAAPADAEPCVETLDKKC